MVDNKRFFIQVFVALFIGVISIVSVLSLLSQGASARPMLDPVNLSISKSASADYVEVGNQLVYTLTYQNTNTITVTGPLTNGTVLTNTATVDNDQTGPTSDDATTIVNAPTLVLIKRDYTDPVPTGALLTYTLTYSNT